MAQANHNGSEQEEYKNDNENNNPTTNLVDSILARVKNKLTKQDSTEENIQFLIYLYKDELGALCPFKEYITECSKVCWVMILQKPPLAIWPTQWIDPNKTKYTEETYQRVLGSDKEHKNSIIRRVACCNTEQGCFR